MCTNFRNFSPVDWTGTPATELTARNQNPWTSTVGGGTSRRQSTDAIVATALARTPALRFNTRTKQPPFRTTNKAVEMVYKNANLKTMRRRAGMQ